MADRRFSLDEGWRFVDPEDAMAAIEQDGFDWRLVRDYFRFTDQWLSEGQYARMLDMALARMADDEGRNVLLDMLDLQYAVFLEQVALQDRMVRKAGCGSGNEREDEDESVAFGERVMAYLQLNANERPLSGRRSDARAALFKIPSGQLIDRLLGDTSTPASRRQKAQEES